MNKYRKIIEIPVEKIKINDKNFKQINKKVLDYFIMTMSKRDIIRPFIVTKVGDEYVLDNCINSFRAIKLLGYKTVPCKVISEQERERKIEFRRKCRTRYMI